VWEGELIGVVSGREGHRVDLKWKFLGSYLRRITVTVSSTIGAGGLPG
jgi:hypothetical protein